MIPRSITCKRPTNPRHPAKFSPVACFQVRHGTKGEEKKKRQGGCGGIDSSKFLSHLPFRFSAQASDRESPSLSAGSAGLEPEFCQPCPPLFLSLSVRRHVFVPDPNQARATNGSSALSGERVQAEAGSGALSKMIVERTGRPCSCHPRSIRLPQVGTEC